MTAVRSQNRLQGGYDPKAGCFQAWLWGVVRNRVRSMWRKQNKEQVLSPVEQTDSEGEGTAVLRDLPQPPADFEGMEEQELQRALLSAAMQKLQERVTPKNFAIYRALLDERSTPEELSLAYGMQTNAIYAVKHRCENMLLRAARALREPSGLR